jgi:hypothetical protein
MDGTVRTLSGPSNAGLVRQTLGDERVVKDISLSEMARKA